MYKDGRKETITKLEIAKRELSEAIMLFFEDRDPVTYFLLGHTSHEIITKIANARGINSMVRDDMTKMINEVGLDKVLTARYGKEYKPKKMDIRGKIKFFVNIEYNKIKHSGGNAEEEVTVHWDTIQILLLDSIEMLKGIGIALSSEHIAFMMWVKKEAPEIYNNTGMLKALECFEKNINEVNKQNLSDFIRDFKVCNVVKKKGYKSGKLPKGKELHHIKSIADGGKTTCKNTRVISKSKHKEIHKNRRKRVGI